MIHIGSYSFEKFPSLEENLQTTQQYLIENNLMIVDEEGIPLADSTIASKIQHEESIVFRTISTFQIEQNTLAEAINYIDNAMLGITTLQESDPEVIISGFVEVIESLIHLDRLVSYFNIQIPLKYNLERTSEKALNQTEDGNTEYLLDILEFEMTPLLEEMKKKFQERINKL